MAEIKLPVRVVAQRRSGFDWFVLLDGDGQEIVRRAHRDNLDRVAAALNENAALRAQVARARALAERWLREGGGTLYGCARELLGALDSE